MVSPVTFPSLARHFLFPTLDLSSPLPLPFHSLHSFLPPLWAAMNPEEGDCVPGGRATEGLPARSPWVLGTLAIPTHTLELL